MYLPDDRRNDIIRPAVLFSSKSPFPVLDVNDAWLTTCGFTREEVIVGLCRIVALYYRSSTFYQKH
jgi:hypothetical protein